MFTRIRYYLWWKNPIGRTLNLIVRMVRERNAVNAGLATRCANYKCSGYIIPGDRVAKGDIGKHTTLQHSDWPYFCECGFENAIWDGHKAVPLSNEPALIEPKTRAQ